MIRFYLLPLMLQIWGRQQTKVDAEKHKQTEKAVNSKLATKVAATTAVAAFVCAHMASAWVNGELSIWMDADRSPQCNNWVASSSTISASKCTPMRPKTFQTTFHWPPNPAKRPI